MDASDLLRESLERHGIHLSLLVADTALWAHPSIHQDLLARTGGVALKPNVRRARTGKGESVGLQEDGARLDSNTYANVELKRALGLRRGDASGFEVCHIWPLTCYDERYHTAPANLVLLPRALAGLSDHDIEIQQCLQYRAVELYDWWPQEQPKPERPAFYPSQWRDPEPPPTRTAKARTPRREASPAYGEEMSSDERELLIGRLQRWATKPDSKVHKMLALVVHGDDSVPRDELVHQIHQATGSKNAYGAVASLLTTNGNSYGRVLVDDGGRIALHPQLADEIRSLTWHRV